LESQEKSKYQVNITDPAEISFYEILEFLFDHYTLDRAEELANALRDTTSSLNDQPMRGALEHRLIGRNNGYRFILFKRIP
jgi:plasmid stabilization system protein ParE